MGHVRSGARQAFTEARDRHDTRNDVTIFRYITDVPAREDALAMLKAKEKRVNRNVKPSGGNLNNVALSVKVLHLHHLSWLALCILLRYHRVPLLIFKRTRPSG